MQRWPARHGRQLMAAGGWERIGVKAVVVVDSWAFFLRGIFLVGEASIELPVRSFVHQKSGPCDAGTRHIMALDYFWRCKPIVWGTSHRCKHPP